MKAIWNGTVVADSDNTVVVESNHYFPGDSLKMQFFAESDKTTHCPWKGEARYYSVTVDDQTAPDAAWYYPAPKDAARDIAGRVAFWRGVQVTE